MKIISISLILLLSLIGLQANISSYSVDNLKLTNINSLSLSISTSTAGNYQNNSKPTSSGKIFLDDTDLHFKLSHQKSNANADLQLSLAFTADGTYQNKKYLTADSLRNDSHRIDKNVSFGPDIDFDYTKYLGAWFIKTSNRLGYNKSNQNSKDHNSDTLDFKTIDTTDNLYCSSQLSFGHGRMYSYAEAFIAWSALKEMTDLGYLKREVTDADIDELASIIFDMQSLNKVSLIDKDRAKLTALFRYLQNSGMLKPETEAKATALLIDTWRNGDSFYSNSKSYGFIDKTFGATYEFEPNISWSKSNRKTNYSRSNHSYNSHGHYIRRGINFYLVQKKPACNTILLSNITNFTFGWSDSYGHYNNGGTDTTIYYHDYTKPYTNGNSDFSITYFPGLRSALSTYYHFYYNDDQEILSLISDFGVKAGYLLNKNTIITADLSYNNSYKKYRNIYKTKFSERLSNFDYQLKIQYSIF